MEEKKKSWKHMTWKERITYLWNSITVEPMLACYIMPSVLASLATQNLNLEKACRVNLAYPDHVCDALSRRETTNYTLEEEKIQQLVAGMAGWKTALQSALPCMMILFWGSWSDRHSRRKPCMLLPIVGEFLAAIGLILCTYFENVPMEVAGVTEALFPGLTGGWFTMFMGIFSYIADVTTEDERTLRIGIANLCFSLGVPIGMAFSGILLKKIGFYGVFSISATLYLIAFVYGVFFVKEPKPKIIDEKLKLDSEKKSLLADFFDREHVINTIKVAFKNGPNQRRMRVIMLMVVVMVVIGPLHGEMSVVYLFTRYRFNWGEVEFSLFSTYGMITGLIGMIFSVGILSHVLKIDDALIGVISSMSKILSGFVYAFAVTDWQLYLGPIVEMLNGTSFIAMRSIATKLVTSDELGKVNSLFGVAEALMPLAYAPMYAAVYAATLNTLPGAFFLLGGALTMPAVLIFLWMYKIHKKENQRKLAESNSYIKQIDSDIDIKKISSITTIDDIQVQKLNNGIQQEKYDGTPKLISMKINQLNGRGSISAGPRGSISAGPRGSVCGIDNSAYDDSNEGVFHGTIEIIKELPALHIERCKL